MLNLKENLEQSNIYAKVCMCKLKLQGKGCSNSVSLKSVENCSFH